MPDTPRLTKAGERDKRVRTASDPYVAPEKPPTPGQRPEDITDRAGAILAQALADANTDVTEAKARYDKLVARRYALIALADTVTVDGKTPTDTWVATFAGLSGSRVGQIRKKPPAAAGAGGEPES